MLKSNKIKSLVFQFIVQHIYEECRCKMCVRGENIKTELRSFLTFDNFFIFLSALKILFPHSFLSLNTETQLFIHVLFSKYFEYWHVASSVPQVKITKKKKKKSPKNPFEIIYCFLTPRDILKSLMFNAHVQILNHWEGFLWRINNQLPEQMKLCIMLKCIHQVEPSSFSGRCCVEPYISLNHSASSPSLVIMYSRLLSFQTLRPLVHDSCDHPFLLPYHLV